MARTDTLPHFLTDVADAIRTKTGDSSPIQASNFDTAIENIPSGGGADLDDYFKTTLSQTSTQTPDNIIKKFPDLVIDDNETMLSSLFQGWSLEKAPKIISNNNITSLYRAYRTASYLKSIDMSRVNIDNVTNFQDTFYGCIRLTSITFGNSLTGQKIKQMNQTFNGCQALTTLDLSNFNTLALTNTNSMFKGCTSLAHIDMRNMTFANVANYTDMFGATASNGVPDDCLIIVKDNTEKTWITSKFSRLTNVKTVAELEAE